MKTELIFNTRKEEIDWNNPPKAVMCRYIDGLIILITSEHRCKNTFSGFIINKGECKWDSWGVGRYSSAWNRESFKLIPEGTKLTFEF